MFCTLCYIFYFISVIVFFLFSPYESLESFHLCSGWYIFSCDEAGCSFLGCLFFFVCLFLRKAIRNSNFGHFWTQPYSLGQASMLLFVEACFHYSQVSFYQLWWCNWCKNYAKKVFSLQSCTLWKIYLICYKLNENLFLLSFSTVHTGTDFSTSWFWMITLGE